MQHIDAKFKDANPAATVKKIQGILQQAGIEYFENWSDSGIENCYSLSVSCKGGVPSANGKGVSKEFAQASAYGEFIERLQGGLLFYKYQSIGRDAAMDIHTFAPDAKYMTVEELEENGEWMDYLIDTYRYPGLSRKSIAKQCRMYACADDGKILTLPFYSLFEKKVVYLPIAFVDQIYGTNGCCAGNTKEEAWVHAFSEMMERHAALKVLTSGKAAPQISEDVLAQFSTVSNILKEIRRNGAFNIDIFDFSIGNGFPVISTRIIDRKKHNYRVNVAADPVLEIAIQRTLTEFFQGRNINNIHSHHGGRILGKASEARKTENIVNQLETGNGLFAADYFANELTCDREATTFADNTKKTNKELLEYCLDIYRKMGKPVYVRNFSFMGFHSYRFIVPGFSEALAVKMATPVQEYAVGDQVCGTFKNVAAATEEELSWFLTYNKMVSGTFGRYNRYGRLSGIPISKEKELLLSCVTRACAAYRLKKYDDAMKYIAPCTKGGAVEERTAEYFACVSKFMEMKRDGIREDKIRCILKKFFAEESASALYEQLDAGKTPFDPYLMRCDFVSCDTCKYRDACNYHDVRNITARIGEMYRNFTHGQDEKEFEI